MLRYLRSKVRLWKKKKKLWTIPCFCGEKLALKKVHYIRADTVSTILSLSSYIICLSSRENKISICMYVLFCEIKQVLSKCSIVKMYFLLDIFYKNNRPGFCVYILFRVFCCWTRCHTCGCRHFKNSPKSLQFEKNTLSKQYLEFWT